MAYFIALTGDRGNFAGAAFLMFAIDMDKGEKKTIVKCTIMAIIYAMKSIVMEITVIQIINLMGLTTAVLLYYYIRFYKKKNPIIVSDIEKQVLDLHIIKALEPKEIADKIYLEPGSITTIIRRLVKKNNCQNKAQFFILIGQRGYKIDKSRIA